MSKSLSRRPASSAHPTRQQLDDLDALLKRMLDLPVNRQEDEPDEEAPPPPTAERESRPVAPASAPEAMRGPHRPTFAREPIAETAAPPAVNYQTSEAEEADLKPRIVQSVPVVEVKETPTVAPARPTPPPGENPAAGGAAEDWVPLTSSWRPSARTWKPLSDAWREAQTATNRPTPVEPPPAPEERSHAPVRPSAPEPEEPEDPLPEPAWEKPPVKPAPAAEQAPAVAAAAPQSQRPRPIPPPAPPRARPRPTVAPKRSVSRPWFLWPLVAFNVVFDGCLTPWGAPGRWLRGPAGRALLGIIGLLCLIGAAALTAADWIGWTR